MLNQCRHWAHVLVYFFHCFLFVLQCVLYLMFTVIQVVMLSAPGKLSQNNSFTRYMVMKQWLSWEKLILNMADIDLRAISMNCDGLNDDSKRSAVFSKLKNRAKEYLSFNRHTALRRPSISGEMNGDLVLCTFHTGNPTQGVLLLW